MLMTMFASSFHMMKEHGGLIFMGFMLYFFSVFGQSLCFGIYLPALENDLGMSKTEIGGLYAAATIFSAVAIIFTGKMLDHMRLRHFVALTCAGLAAGCFVMAGAIGPLSLFIAFFLLRQFGQGLMVLSATTSVNRYLERNRGKAQALASLGASAHLIVFPLLALTLENYFDWRVVWFYYGLFTALLLLPGFWFYLRAHQSKTHQRWQQRVQAASAQAAAMLQKDWTQKHVIMNWRFYALVALTLIAPFVGTAIFFFQRELAASLGLTPMAFAASFPVFTISYIICAFAAGVVIDRYGEKPVLASYPLVYMAGLILLTLPIHNGMLLLTYGGMFLIGAANGMVGTATGPLLAQLYGTKYLGGIKSLLFSTTIVSSALSPLFFGFLLDQGYAITTLLAWVIPYAALVWLLAFPLCRDTGPPDDNKMESVSS